MRWMGWWALLALGCAESNEMAVDAALPQVESPPPLPNPTLSGDCAAGEVDVWLLLHHSGAFQSSWPEMTAATEAFLLGIADRGARVGIIAFENEAEVVVPMTAVDSMSLDVDFLDVVRGITPRQNTNYHAAYLALEAEHLVAPADLSLMVVKGAPNLCIDPTGTPPPFACVADVPAAGAAAQEVSDRLRADGVRTMALGINLLSSIGRTSLRQTAGRVEVQPHFASDLNRYDYGVVSDESDAIGPMGFIGRRVCSSAR